MKYFKRPLLPLLAMYGLGLWLATVFQLSLAAFIAIIVSVVWALRMRDFTPIVLATFFLCGIWMGHRISSERIKADHVLRMMEPPISATVCGRVSSIDLTGDISNNRFVLRHAIVETVAGAMEFPGGILVTLTASGESLTTTCPNVGQIVEISGSLSRPPSYRNFFVASYEERLARQRIYAVMRTSSWVALSSSGFTGHILSALNALRMGANRVLAERLSRDESRWVASFLFNDRRLLRPDEIRQLRDSNMFHLFAVSGLHVGALAAVLLLLARLLRCSWPISWLITILSVWGYAAMTGFVPSALRASTMLSAYGISTWIRREVDPLNALIFACFVLLVFEPTLIHQPGFILSAMGVLGIVAMYPIITHVVTLPQSIDEPCWYDPLRNTIWDVAKVTAAVTMFLLPLQLYFFHQINVLSPLANLAGACLSAPLIAVTLLTLAASQVCGPLANILGAATTALADALMEIIRTTASQNWAIVRTPQLSLAAVCTYYAIFISGYYWVRRDTPEFIPKARARLLLHSFAAVLVLLLNVVWQRADRRLKVWFLDVGQGDSTLMQLPTGQSVLVDTGNVIPNIGRIVVIPHLQAVGCYPLDYLVVTHLDSDHTGSVPILLEEWAVNNLVVSNDIPSLDGLMPDSSRISSLPRIIRVCAGQQSLLDRALELEVLNPDCQTSASSASNNDRSIVLRLSYKNFSLLMTGDAEEPAEEQMLQNELFPCDVLKVGHHGSVSSSSESFLQAISPQIAIISCGKNNQYGHPSPVVIERLSHHGATVFRTDIDGAVAILTNGFKMEIWKAASRRHEPISLLSH